jgi:putative transposase
VANRRCHAETHEAPIERWAAAGFAPTYPSPSRLHEAFRWSVLRRVSKTATVSFQANRYAVGPALVGKVVELRFDPEDLSQISVYLNGEPAGEATAFVIGRHVHPAVPQAPPPPPAPEERSGIDYMALVARAEAVARGEGSIDYRVALAAGSLGDGTGATAGADQAVVFDEEAS